MKTPIVVVFAAAIAGLLFGSVSTGAEPRPDQKSRSVEAIFKSLDRDLDQSISKVEAKADSSLSAAFSSADVNLDGYITKPEYLAYLERLAAPPE
jgi:hypothetical protein